MRWDSRIVGALGLALVVGARVFGEGPRPDEAPALEFFEKKVRPILVSRCYNCHSADTKPAGGLRVDDRKGLLTGGKAGPAVVPGKPSASLLLKRVTQKDGKQRMPRESEALSDQEVADLTRWIQDGAPWPAPRLPASLGKPRPQYEKRKKEHWAWQPLTDPKAPLVTDKTWSQDPIDRFILARLESKGLRPVGDADKLALIRRVTFDVTGLPPTPEEVAAFLADSSPEAYEHVVDRLLASPAFGERWGRLWLDVARYGESTGPSRNIPYPHAWRYRDYVIASFNADKPYDRFVQEQIAGDLLPASSPRERDELLTATGLLALGVKDVNQRFEIRFVMDNVDEQIDVVSRSILALTVSCARCHDHKFDPIPTTDYYALAGIFTSTDNCAGLRNRMGGAGLAYYNPAMLVKLSTGAPPPAAAEVEKLKEQVAKAKAEWEAIRGTKEGKSLGANGQPKQRPFRLNYERLEAELASVSDPTARRLTVHGVREGKAIGDTEIRIRGEAEKTGPVAPRGFLSTFEVPGAAKVDPAHSGRLELARWLTSPGNPLTARVMVNRIWQQLFGVGIVQSVDNFGVMGEAPSNPELLDHLASRFIRDGWSIKKMVRTTLLTRAYRLSSEAPETHRGIDPANRLVWRHRPRRLNAEEIRDAMLASAGTLKGVEPADSPVKALRMIEMRDNGPEAGRIREYADRCVCRSIYLPLLRGLTPRPLEAFDPVEQTLVTGSRDETTVPGQALFLLNSPFVRQQSLALADRLLAKADATDNDRIHLAYRRILGRAATAPEIERARTFLAEFDAASREAAPAKLAPAKSSRTAAWMSFVQALLGSAEFRYVR